MVRDKIYSVGNFSKDYLEANPDVKLSVTLINKVIKVFNDLMLDEILINNYEYYLGNCYKLSMERYERNFNTLAVDWGASNKLKKEIIERGEKPAKKIGTTPKGNPIFDDGVQWMIFYTDDFYCSLNFKFRTQPDLTGTRKFSYYNFGSIFWKCIKNDKLMARLNNYEKQNKLSKNNIPLANGIKNYIF